MIQLRPMKRGKVSNMKREKVSNMKRNVLKQSGGEKSMSKSDELNNKIIAQGDLNVLYEEMIDSLKMTVSILVDRVDVLERSLLKTVELTTQLSDFVLEDMEHSELGISTNKPTTFN